MKKYKKFTSVLLISTVLTLLVSISVGVSAQTDTVTATVTVSSSSISLDQSTFAYGSTPANTATSTVNLFGGSGITATNNGSAADLDIQGANTADWTLGATTAEDQYVHKFCNDTDSDCSTPETNYTALTTSYQTLKSSVAADGTVAFQLSLTTPNPSTVFTEQSAVVTIQASAL